MGKGYAHKAPHTHGHNKVQMAHDFGSTNATPGTDIAPTRTNVLGSKGNALRGPAKGGPKNDKQS